MPEARNYVTYNSWVGYNDTVPPDNMLDVELRKCDNGITYFRGGIAKRPGCEKVNPEPFNAEVTWAREWPFSDGSSKLICIVDRKLCLLDDNGNLIEKTTVASDEIGYVFYKDAMYFVDGESYRVWGWVDYSTLSGSVQIKAGNVVKNYPISTHATNPGVEGHFYKAKSDLGTVDLKSADFGDTSKWDDITNGPLADHIIDVPADSGANNDLTPIKRCKYIEWHPTSYMFFFAGNDKDPAALYFSEPGKPNYVKATNVVYPTTANGPITGIKTFIRHLMVAYKRTWRVWSGTVVGADAQWKPLPIPYGCVANDTICLTPNSLTFQAEEGICMVSPSILSDDVQLVVDKDLFIILSDKKVENTIKSMVNKHKNKAVYHDGKYYLAYCDDPEFGKPNKVLVMDWDTKGFMRFTGWQVNCWCQRENGELLFGSKNYLIRTGVGYNDINVEDGSYKPVIFDVQTKPYNGGTPFLKLFELIFLTAQQYVTAMDISNLTIEFLTDYVTTSITTDINESLVWGRSWGKLWGFSEIINQWAVLNKQGSRIQISFKDDSLDNQLFIYAITIAFTVISDIKGDPIPTGLLITE